MEEAHPEVKMVKSMLRAVLISSKEGVPAETLHREYREMVGDFIPYKKFGFNKLEEFIVNIPDVVRVARKGPEFICHAVADESTAHIQKLVSKQRSKKPKRPVRRPRGGGAGGRFLSRTQGYQRAPPPRMVPRSFGPPSRVVTPDRRGVPSSFMMANRQMSPVTISIGNSSSGSRTISLGPSLLLSKAMQDANTGRSQQLTQDNKSRFETPPRFRKQQAQSLQAPVATPTSSASYKRTSPKRVFAKMTDGDKYMSELLSYMSEMQQGVSFETTPAAQGFVSSIMINKVTYGSEDVYATSTEAEQAVAKVAMSKIERKKASVSSLPEIDWDDTSSYNPVLNWADDNNSRVPGATSIPPEKLRTIKTRVKEILQNKRNGLWGSNMPFQYKRAFSEDPPDNLLDLIKTWNDIARVEFVPSTDREIVYPVIDDSNKLLIIPEEALLGSDVKVLVYMTYIHNLGYFWVQRDDSVIDDLTEQLQVHCKSSCSPDPTTMEKGRFCAGMYSADNQWTRAQILNVKDNRQVELLFVDYGNCEDVSVDRVRWLSPELAAYPAQAVSCSLYGVEPLEDEREWSSRSLTVFADMVKEEAMEAIPKRQYDNFVEVDLYLKSDMSESIADKLVKAGVVKNVRDKIETLEKMEPDPIYLPEDKQWDVYITYINASTNSVMVRLVGEEYSDRLDGYQARLQGAFSGGNSECSTVSEGITYVAFDDMLYHRVRLMSTEGKRVNCYFLDHGDTDALLPEQLQPLDPKVNRMLPYQAIEVSLYGLEDVSTNTTALERLCELALTKTCVAEVIERQSVPSVILFDTSTEDEDININDKILEAIEADGGGIDSSGSSSSTPQRILSPVPSEPQRVISPAPSEPRLSLTKTSDFSPAVTPSADSVHIDKHSTPVENNNVAVNKLQNLSLAESTIHTDSPAKSPTSKYLPPSPTESPPRSVCETSSFALERTPEVSEICDKKDTNKQSPSLSLSKPDLLTNIPDSSIKREDESETKKKPQHFKTVVPFKPPPVGEYLEVHIDIIHDPDNFVCLPYEELNNLTELFAAMQDYYDGKPPVQMTKADIKQGEMYAGWRDELWYRVKVTQFVSQDLMSVYLVDNGEYSVLELTEIQPLYKQFYPLPMMALPAKLGGIEPVGGSWSEAAKYKFIELAKERDLIGLVLGQDEKRVGALKLRLIDTSSDADLCIDEVLVQMGYAKVVPI